MEKYLTTGKVYMNLDSREKILLASVSDLHVL